MICNTPLGDPWKKDKYNPRYFLKTIMDAHENHHTRITNIKMED